MSSNNKPKYVPVHLRNKNNVAVAPEPPKPKPYEEEFPALGSTASKTIKVWGGEETFAEKARQWNNLDNLKKQEEEELRKEREYMNKISAPRNLPRFHNVRRFVEEDSEESQEENDEKNDQPKNDNEWTLVQKGRNKAKKEKTVEQILKEKMEKESDSEGNDESVWNEEKRPNETYWDERQY